MNRIRGAVEWVGESEWRTAVLAFLALALARGVAFTFVVPPWQHPDEPTHFEHARYIAEYGEFPNRENISIPLRLEIALSMMANGFWADHVPDISEKALSPYWTPTIGYTTFDHPHLYYLVGGWWLKPWLRAPIETQLYALRMLSVLFNLSVISMAAWVVRYLYPRSQFMLMGTLGFLVFQPMYTDIMASVNNDVLMNALGSAFFLILALAVARGVSIMKGVALGLILVGGVFTKSTSIILLAALPFGLISIILGRWGQQRPWRLLGLLVFFGAIGAGSVFTEGGQAILLQIESTISRMFNVYASSIIRTIIDPDRWSFYNSVSLIVFQSFWAAFGWRNVLLALPFYLIPLGMILLSVAGFAKGIWEGARQANGEHGVSREYPFLLIAGAGVLIAWVVTVLRGQTAGPGGQPYYSHGRYAFVALLPLAVLLNRGIEMLLPEGIRLKTIWGMLGVWVLFDAVAFWGYLVPFSARF